MPIKQHRFFTYNILMSAFFSSGSTCQDMTVIRNTETTESISNDLYEEQSKQSKQNGYDSACTYRGYTNLPVYIPTVV